MRGMISTLLLGVVLWCDSSSAADPATGSYATQKRRVDEVQARPLNVTLGMLMPLFGTADGIPVIDYDGRCNMLASLMAIDDINNNIPPYDTLLPHTKILFTVRDSKRSEADASLRALDLLSAGVDAVVGPGSSGPTGQ